MSQYPRYKSNLNNQNAVMQANVSYIHVDSSRRQKKTINIYEEEIHHLPPHAIHFSNGSSKITINFPNHNMAIDDKIILYNVTSKSVILQNVLMVKKNSYYMRIFHQNHGLSLYGLYDPINENSFEKIDYVDNLYTSYHENEDIRDETNKYYILRNNSNINPIIELSNIKGSDFSRNFIGNIPTNFLNKKHIVYLLFVKSGNKFVHDRNSYLIKLEKKASINYMDNVNFIKDKFNNPTNVLASNMIHIRFHTLYGIPLEYLNFGIDSYSKNLYTTILETTKNNFVIDVNFPAVVDPEIDYYDQPNLTGRDYNISQSKGWGGGGQIYLRRIKDVLIGYPEPNKYRYKLDRIYRNIISAKIIASEFPNSQNIISNKLDGIKNNKIYWRNLDDGNYIYQLSIIPGNYSPLQLKRAIEKEFRNTIRYRYTKEYLSGIIPKIIEKSTPDDFSSYDNEGYYKYHIVKVSISNITDEVTFRFFREIIRTDDIVRGIHAIKIPDYMIEFEISEGTNIESDFENDVNMYHSETSISFNPDKGEVLYIYFTPNCHEEIHGKFPYAYGNLYQYLNFTDKNKFVARMVVDRSLLINFYGNNPTENSTTVINSINTSTLLKNFSFDYFTNQIELKNHNLKVGDLIITDQFSDPRYPSNIFVYEIITIINSNIFKVIRYTSNDKYRFIYDGLAINFDNNKNNKGAASALGDTNKISFFVSIRPLSIGKTFMIVNHPNHNLSEGDIIKISNSGNINQVPSYIINGKHRITKILDENNYRVELSKYIPTIDRDDINNTIIIRYPDVSQMFFNFGDTIGKILNFSNVGEDIAITPYRHMISNKDTYNGQYQESNIGMQKINMTGDNYFYICCPELNTIQNTTPVSNVFSVIRWYENPGKVVFDSFITTTKIFNPPLSTLSELNFEFRKSDGNLVDFNGIDHSFTIEITEMKTVDNNLSIITS